MASVEEGSASLAPEEEEEGERGEERGGDEASTSPQDGAGEDEGDEVPQVREFSMESIPQSRDDTMT